MLSADIRRLIAPRSIALIGASAWTDAVAAGNVTIGYRGTVWRVHPTRASTREIPFYRSIAELPGVPDAAFIAVPNHEAPAVAGALAARGAGGFVCFSSGFGELGTEVGRKLDGALREQAGELPFFGPNCYGFVNFFDRAAMLPDQIVGEPLERGVALICQSGTISLSLSFNDRSVPIGYLFSVGNQSRLAVEDLIEVLCEDPRVTAFGLYLEGIKNAERFAAAADKARRAGKPIAVIKTGRTAAAARTAHSHTGALAGADSVFDAFCRQAHRRDQDRPHRCRGAHGAQPHRRSRRSRQRLRRILPAGRPGPMRHARRSLRDAQAVSCRRRARRPQGADHGRLGR
jgi:acyl-CoA synthetase (NDP forming)